VVFWKVADIPVEDGARHHTISALGYIGRMSSPQSTFFAVLSRFFPSSYRLFFGHIIPPPVTPSVTRLRRVTSPFLYGKENL